MGLTENKTPWGLLDAETRARFDAAHKNGQKIEFFNGQQWVPVPYPRWSGANAYRVQPEPPVEIPWHLMKPEYTWAAMDENGKWWAYGPEPKMSEDVWIVSTGPSAPLYALTLPTVSDWTASKQKRPE